MRAFDSLLPSEVLGAYGIDYVVEGVNEETLEEHGHEEGKSSHLINAEGDIETDDHRKDHRE